MNRGLQEYQDLNYDRAVELLKQATEQLDPRSDDYARIMPYLAASFYFQGQPDSASAAFSSLLIHHPRYEIDQLTFPPAIWAQFETDRRTTSAAEVELPRQSTILVNQDGVLTAKAFVSSRHWVEVDIQRSIGGTLTTLHRGWIADSLELRWQPRNAAGRPIPEGRYFLSVTSTDNARRPVRSVRVPLDVSIFQSDTLNHPPPPADSMFLPERGPQLSGKLSLARGLGAAAAVLIGPAVFASGADLTAPRISVSLVAGLVGYFGLKSPPLGPPLPENVDANEALIIAWQNEIARIVDENQRRVAGTRMTIRAGDPVFSDSRGQ
jgi:hypothetical protein